MSTPNDTIISIAKVPEGVRVSWAGGFPPYQLQKCDVIGGEWSNIGNPTMATGSTQSALGEQGYFRVWQSVPLLDVDTTKPQTTLVWSVPDLAPSSMLSEPPPLPPE